MTALELTLCSVSYKSARFLRLNEQLVRRLNPDTDIRWIVAENSPADANDRLGEADRSSFTLIEGAGSGHIATYHHTLALRECTRRSTTRYVAVIDPDLFVVRPNWGQEVIAHMQQERLAFIGVPWHPQSQGKYRYFPAVHLTVFDTSVFDRDAIDFLPDYPDGDTDPAWAAGWTLQSRYFARSRAVRLLSRLPLMASRRQYYTDTGSRFYKRWVSDPAVRWEALVPRWRPPEPVPGLRARLRALIPDELDFIPRRYPAATFAVPHRMAQAASALPPHWESFEWRRELFCFHVRGNLDRQARSAEAELSTASALAAAACGGVDAWRNAMAPDRR
jgi:hypothetical protein